MLRTMKLWNNVATHLSTLMECVVSLPVASSDVNRSYSSVVGFLIDEAGVDLVQQKVLLFASTFIEKCRKRSRIVQSHQHCLSFAPLTLDSFLTEESFQKFW